MMFGKPDDDANGAMPRSVFSSARMQLPVFTCSPSSIMSTDISIMQNVGGMYLYAIATKSLKSCFDREQSAKLLIPSLSRWSRLH